jgi:uncharacterized protein (TIGR03083 family)
MLSPTRTTFLGSAQAAARLLEQPAVTARWDEPSVLTGYTVGGLAAHLGRAVSTPLGYLDAEITNRSASTDAVEYFLESLGDADPVDSDLHRSVRQRSDDMAASGPLAVLDATREALQSLTGRLEVEPDDRVVVVFGGVSMTLDDYLQTRIVELVIHADDLAASCRGVDVGAIPDTAWAVAREVVAEVAARRVGDREFVLGLSRSERAQRPLAF